MEKSEIHKSDSIMKYGIPIMVLAAFAALVAIPLLANAENADCGYHHWDKSGHVAFMEKRQNALHDKLALSATQETAWSDFVAKSKTGEHQARPDRSEWDELNTPDRLDHILAKMKERQQEMESRAQAVKSFYAQLTPAQQKIFDDSFAHRGDGHGMHGKCERPA